MNYNKSVLVKDFSNYLPGNKGAEIISSVRYLHEYWVVAQFGRDETDYESYENFISYLLKGNDVISLIKFRSNESLIKEAIREGLIKFEKEIKLINHQ